LSIRFVSSVPDGIQIQTFMLYYIDTCWHSWLWCIFDRAP